MKLHRYLVKYLDQIEQSLGLKGTLGIKPSDMTTDLISEVSEESRIIIPKKRVFTQLSILLAQLGPPPDLSKIQRSEANPAPVAKSTIGILTTNQFYSDFIARIDGRNDKSKYLELYTSRKCFYEKGISRERRPVVYYICKRVKPEIFDFDLFLYFIIVTLKSIGSRPFELLVDCTQFSGDCEWKMELIQTFFKIIPTEYILNLQCLYFYNANTSFRKFTKKIAHALNFKSEKKFIFASTQAELAEHILEIHLPSTTLALDLDSQVISPVTNVSMYRQQIPVNFKLSKEFIQITTLKNQDVLGCSVILNDVFHIGDIVDINSTSGSADKNEFVFEYSEKIATYKVGGASDTISSLKFSSPKSDSIVAAIKKAKQKYNSGRTANTLSDRRDLAPSDVPGTLLNMILLNFCSEDANLRVASYNLLCGLSSSFKFDVGNLLLVSKGAFFN